MKKKLITAGASALLFLLLILLVRTVDVAPIGPAGATIGLSGINRAMHNLCGIHDFWYNLTDWLGFAAIAAAACFAALGLVQLIRRRSLRKLDRELLALGVLYAVVIGLYMLFEIAIVNYRPVLMPGSHTLEASFPSSHTMLIIVTMGSAGMLTEKYVRQGGLRRILRAVCAAVLAVTVIGRLLSGVHWFTDILGGVLISTALLSLYAAFLSAPKPSP